MPRKRPAVNRSGACAFCHSDDNHPLLGNLLEKGPLKFHANCIFAASGLSQDKDEGYTDENYIHGFHIESIQRELRRARVLNCSYCRFSGASVGCVVGSCPCSFHLPCITKANGITIFKDPFPSYCRRHVPKQNLDAWLKQPSEAPSCCICLFSIVPEELHLDNKPKLKRSPTLRPATTPIAVRQLPRRSCVAMTTPKRIRVSVTCEVRSLSVSNSSSWEVSDPVSEEQVCESPQPSPDTVFSLAPSLIHLPDWLKSFLSTLPTSRQLSVYQSWLHDTVHGACCPKAWMHRDCINGYAVSAALHYLKCPYCADRQIFIPSVLDAGVWVPDRDAAWELEPGAFAELGVSDTTSDSDSPRISESNETSSLSATHTVVPEGDSTPQQMRSMRRSARRVATISVATDSPPSTPTPNPKPILTLVWNNRQFETRGRSSATQPRHRQRRFTQMTVKKTSPDTVQRRINVSRRRLSLFPCNSAFEVPLGSQFSDNHRLRQATLGSFLANFRVSSPS
ncbi:unnamed protein product [Dicrocoelium dendriticum]|nr:unnamed protein product [Dicrocoelium dendriticum]